MTCASPVLYTKGTVLIFNPYVFVNYWDNMTGRRSNMILINKHHKWFNVTRQQTKFKMA